MLDEELLAENVNKLQQSLIEVEAAIEASEGLTTKEILSLLTLLAELQEVQELIGSYIRDQQQQA